MTEEAVNFIDKINEAQLWIETATGVSAEELQQYMYRMTNSWDFHEHNQEINKLVNANFVNIYLKMLMMGIEFK
jgi:hypothetical protein